VEFLLSLRIVLELAGVPERVPKLLCGRLAVRSLLVVVLIASPDCSGIPVGIVALKMGSCEWS
jgi:hypothetical protein